MENETKTQLNSQLQAIAQAMKKWSEVSDIAYDIVAYTERNARRFRIQIGTAVGTKVIYAYVEGAEIYATYGEEVNDMPLRQIFEKFFDDQQALVNMIRTVSYTHLTLPTNREV